MTDETEDVGHESGLVDALDRLEAWDVAEPPEGFGDRVLGAYDATHTEALPMNTSAEVQPASRPAGRWGWLVVAAAVVVGAASVATLVSTAVEDAHGSVTAQQQRTVSIAERATVVAEAGTALSWTTDEDGAVVVEQPRGAAFYRVESGEPFAVQTPAGVVRVTGTCFAVDVQSDTHSRKTMMNNRTKAGAMGAALAAAVTVTVYEGSTVLANEAGTVDVGPGQRGVADAGTAPRLTATEDEAAGPEHGESKRDQVAALRAETHRQAAEIAALSNKLAQARGDVVRPYR